MVVNNQHLCHDKPLITIIIHEPMDEGIIFRVMLRPLVLYFHGNAETVDTYTDPEIFHPLQASKANVLDTWLWININLG